MRVSHLPSEKVREGLRDCGATLNSFGRICRRARANSRSTFCRNGTRRRSTTPETKSATTGKPTFAFETNTNVVPSSSLTIWGPTGDFPAFDNIAAYNVGDVVTYNNQFWVKLVGETAPPGTVHGAPPDRPGYWKLLSSYYPPPQIYAGTQTQLPNSLIQAAEGVAVTPAFRGLILAVFENWPLQNFGNRIPNLRGEVTYTKTNNLL